MLQSSPALSGVGLLREKYQTQLVLLPKIYFLVLSEMGAKVKGPANMLLEALVADIVSHGGKKIGKSFLVSSRRSS